MLHGFYCGDAVAVDIQGRAVESDAHRAGGAFGGAYQTAAYAAFAGLGVFQAIFIGFLKNYPDVFRGRTVYFVSFVSTVYEKMLSLFINKYIGDPMGAFYGCSMP